MAAGREADRLIVGITGNIACGKSTVDGMLLDLGVRCVIDADRVVHELLAGDGAVQEAIAARFGRHLLSPVAATRAPAPRPLDAAPVAAGIDRRALGAIVFADPAALRDLEAIVHPRVRERIAAQVAALPPGAAAVVDAIKLLQGSLADMCTSRWWVVARPDQQVARLMESRGMTRDEALRRIAAGPRLEDWRHRVDVVIDNSGSLAETRAQVERAWRTLSSRSP
jgi:dephospho-CoA kinase